MLKNVKQENHRVKIVLALMLILSLVVGIFPQLSFANASNVLEAEDGTTLEGTNVQAKAAIKELEKNDGVLLYATTDTRDASVEVKLTYTKTIRYEDFFTRNFRVTIDGKKKVAYCVQPKETPPAEGTHTATDYNNKAMVKALYYCYGYPGYGKKLQQYVSKKDKDDDWEDDDDAYALCHMILSYLYDKESMNSDAFTGVSSDTKKLVISCAEKIEGWADPPTDTSISVTPSTATSTWDAAKAVQKTQIFKLNTHEDNSVSITVPSGAIMYRTSDGVTKTFAAGIKVKVYGGDTFYFTGNKNLTGIWSSGTLTGTLQEFNPYMIKVTGHQNIIFCGTGDKDSVSFKVQWVEKGWMRAEKGSEDWEKARDNIANVFADVKFTLSGNGLESRSLTVTKDGKLQDSSGNTTIELMPGSYNLKETTLPDRYKQPVNTTVVIKPGQTTSLSGTAMANINKKGKFKVLKVYKEDLQDDESLVFDREEGVKFRIWDYDYYDNKWSFEKVPDFFKDEITTNAQGEAETKELPIGHYLVQQVTKDKNHWAVEDFVLDITDSETTAQPVTVIGNKTSTQEWLKIVKMDADTDKVVKMAGAQFQIQDAKGNVISFLNDQQQAVDTFTTNAEGIAIVRGKLLPGDYKVVEVKAPAGYAIAKDPVKFNISSDNPKGETVTVKVSDKPQKAQLIIHKLAESLSLGDKEFSYKEVPMPFVKFDVKAAEKIQTADGTVQAEKGEVVAENIMTNENGTAKTEPIFPGEYDVIEKGLYSKIKEYTMKDTDVTNVLTNYQLMLQDKEEASPTPDEMDVFKAAISGTLISNLMTDGENSSWSIPNNGSEYAFDQTQMQVLDAYLKQLPVDQIKESWKDLPLDRYKVPENGIIASVTLKAGDQTKEVIEQELSIVNKLKKGDMELTKTDVSTGEVLPDTGIRIYDEEENIYFEGRTDEEGKIVIKNLPEGNYFFQEYEAPEGYLIDESLYPFSIKDGEVTKCEMTNKMLMGKITLQKDGEKYNIKDKKEYEYTKTNALADAQFDVIAAEVIKSATGKVLAKKGDKVDSVKTDENGKAITKELYLGKYTLKETKAPEGYVLTKEVTVEVKAKDDKTPVTNIDVKIENRLARGTVEITKTDVSTGKALPDTGIRIYDKDKKVVLEGKTDKDGKLTFKELPLGKYYFQEYDAPKGYVINKKLYPFEIKKDGDIIKCKMTNKAEIVRVPKTGDDTPMWPFIGVILSGLALAGYRIYRRRKIGQ